jgi:hypothetical protein
MQGQEQQGMAQMRQCTARWQALGSALVQPYLLALLAEIAGKTGQIDGGLHWLDEPSTSSVTSWHERSSCGRP